MKYEEFNFSRIEIVFNSEKNEDTNELNTSITFVRKLAYWTTLSYRQHI